MVCLEAIIRQLSEKGFKLTPQRKLLLEILFHSRGHLSAEEIFEEVKTTQPNVSFGTIYRNLSLLAEMGVINQLNFKDGRSRFELSQGHHHHLICLDCGNAIDVPECPFSKIFDDTASANKFLIKEHNFEVYGYCEGCNKTKQAKAAVSATENAEERGDKE